MRLIPIITRMIIYLDSQKINASIIYSTALLVCYIISKPEGHSQTYYICRYVTEMNDMDKRKYLWNHPFGTDKNIRQYLVKIKKD